MTCYNSSTDKLGRRVTGLLRETGFSYVSMLPLYDESKPNGGLDE